MSRALLMLALLVGSAFSTPEIPSKFFEAQGEKQADGEFALRRAYYEESFRAWMGQHGVTFGTKGEFERRLRIFAENRCAEWSGCGRWGEERESISSTSHPCTDKRGVSCDPRNSRFSRFEVGCGLLYVIVSPL